MRGSGSCGFGSGVGLVLSSDDTVGWWPPGWGRRLALALRRARWAAQDRPGHVHEGGPDPLLLRRHPSCREPVTIWARLTPNRRRIGVRRSENAVVEDEVGGGERGGIGGELRARNHSRAIGAS